MTDVPKVSIVLVAGDSPGLLRRSLRSALAQVFSDFEIVVVNDGAMPHVGSVISESGDSRIRSILHTVFHGTAAAKNTGIHAARAAFVAFLEEGDEWHPDKLAVQYDSFQKVGHEVGISVTNARTETGPRLNIPEGTYDGIEIILGDFRRVPISAQMMRAEVFKKIGYFDAGLPSHEEIDLALRICGTYRVQIIPDVLVRLSDKESAGENLKKQMDRARGREVVLGKHRNLSQKYPTLYARQDFILATWYQEMGDRKKASRYFLRSFQLTKHPWYLARYVLSTIRLF